LTTKWFLPRPVFTRTSNKTLGIPASKDEPSVFTPTTAIEEVERQFVEGELAIFPGALFVNIGSYFIYELRFRSSFAECQFPPTRLVDNFPVARKPLRIESLRGTEPRCPQ
jgi:hypothetical protein